MADAGQAIIREMRWGSDAEQLREFDASFSTKNVYRITVNQMSVAIVEESLPDLLQKTYRLDHLRDDVLAADCAVVAEINKTIVGFATIRYEEWNARAILTNLLVAPENKGGGIGRALINVAVIFAKNKSGRCLWAETQNVNYPAIQFYLHIGFRFCGFDNNLYNPADVTKETAFYFCFDL